MMTEPAIDPTKRAEIQAKIEATTSLPALRLLARAKYKDDSVAQYLIYQEVLKRDSKDTMAQGRFKELEKTLLAAQNQRTSSHSSAGSSPGAQSSADSNSSGNDSSGEFVVGPNIQVANAVEEAPDLQKIAELQAHLAGLEKQLKVHTIKQLVSRLNVLLEEFRKKTLDPLLEMKEKRLQQFREINETLEKNGISSMADYEKLSSFKKKKKVVFKDEKKTLTDLMVEKDKLARQLATCEAVIKPEAETYAEMWQKKERLAKLTEDEIVANFSDEQIEKIGISNDEFAEKLRQKHPEFVEPQQPSAPVTQPQRTVGQPVGSAASINHAWMRQGQPQPPQALPQRGQQSVSQLINNAYRK